MPPTKKPPSKRSKRPKQPKPASSSPKAELPVLAFASPAKFAGWIGNQPPTSPGLWLRLAKKASTLKTLSYQQALDVALAWGWIDGQLKTYDHDSWVRKFLPRGARS